MADDDEVPEIETGGGGSSKTQEAEIREVRSENASYRVRGLIVNVYTSNPFYNRCTECGTSVKEDEGGDFMCEEHGEVEEPDKALAVSAVIDDGTDNIRTVFFRELARELLEIGEEVEEEGNESTVEEAGENALGKELEVEGRTRYNDYFGQLEIIANEIKNIDSKQELEELLEVMEA